MHPKKEKVDNFKKQEQIKTEDNILSGGVKGMFCSSYIPSEGLVASGEWKNDKSKSNRNAVVVFTEAETGRLVGINCFTCFGYKFVGVLSNKF